MSAAREYKEVIAGLAEAAAAQRDRDRERAADFVRTFEQRDADMLKASGRAALTRIGVELHWEAAIEALWVESWMKLRPRPGPDPHADPADLATFEIEVEQRSAELQEAARRRRFGLRPR